MEDNQLQTCTCGDTAVYMNAYATQGNTFFCADCVPEERDDRDWYYNQNGFAGE